uniref:Homeodomain 1 mating type protein n=1 Tax=Pleurotus tuoliensis TaxID=879823 RepID=G8DA01_9AGAR|nr:homeodomain 1 mating type protein [Pleurotus tuoliensis]
MALDIRNRLLSAERDLIDALDNPSSLQDFLSPWESVLFSLTSEAVDEETTKLASTTAHHVTVIASGILELHEGTSAITTRVMADLDDLLQHLSLAESSNEPSRERHSTPSLSPQSRNRTCSAFPSPPPPYIAPAYKWLLKNIRNPYPSKETKELISRGTGTSLQNIDAWFLNTRRRIGWTSISKKFFSGSKVDTIAAAFRALKDDLKPSISATDDEAERSPLPANIQMAFVEMEDAAKRLYSEKFTKSELAGTLDRMVKDMTDGDKKRRREEKEKEKALGKMKAGREREDKRSRDAQRRWKEAQEGYPSPSPEPESSKRRFETPSSVDSEEEDLTPPLPIAGRKRAWTEDSTDERPGADERPAKRSRILSSSSSCSSIDTLYSVSRQNSLEPFPSSPSSTACSTPPPPTPSEDTPASLPHQEASPKRKRRLSDADAEPRPKRSMPLVRPRLQVVSDPLPKSVTSVSLSTSSPSLVDGPAINDRSQFFDQHFMAVTEELDTAGPIKMDMFDYSQFADYASGGETSDGTDWEAQCEPFNSRGLPDPISHSSSPAIHVPSLSTLTDFDLPAPVSVLPDFELDFCATLGWPYVGSVPSKPASTGSALEDTVLNNLDGLSSLASLPPHEPGLFSASETSRSNEGGFDIDWSSIIPHTIPPTQPVVSSLPTPATVAPITINPTAYLGGSAESRAEKLRKYQEHLAQAKRLQEELAFV